MSEQEQKAVKRLEQYPSLLIEHMGPRYADSPRFKRAVAALTQEPCRDPRSVILDHIKT